jgi:hypothetical protein
VFALTIRATTVATFDHTPAPATSGVCSTTERAEGFLTVHFGTRRPVLVRFVGGRLQTVTATPLDGTAVLHGTNLMEEACATGDPTFSTLYCRATTRTFRNARSTLRGPGPGTVTLTPVRIALRPIKCPHEPNELRRAILAPTPGPLRISPSGRSGRLTLTGLAIRTRTYGSPEAGFLQQRSSWKLTFVRTAR